MQHSFRKFFKSSKVEANLINSLSLENTRLGKKVVNKLSKAPSPFTDFTHHTIVKFVITWLLVVQSVNETNGAFNGPKEKRHFNTRLGSVVHWLAICY